MYTKSRGPTAACWRSGLEQSCRRTLQQQYTATPPCNIFLWNNIIHSCEHDSELFCPRASVQVLQHVAHLRAPAPWEYENTQLRCGRECETHSWLTTVGHFARRRQFRTICTPLTEEQLQHIRRENTQPWLWLDRCARARHRAWLSADRARAYQACLKEHLACLTFRMHRPRFSKSQQAAVPLSSLDFRLHSAKPFLSGRDGIDLGLRKDFLT